MNNLISDVKQYMFTNNNSALLLLLKNFIKKEIKNNKLIIKKDTKIKNNQYLEPKFNDTLFWCFFIIDKGMTVYSLIHNTEFKNEKEIKIKLIDKIRDNKDILKKNKWKRAEIEHNLLYEKNMSINSFLCCCFLNKINILVFSKFMYYENIFNNDNELFLIKKKNENYYLYVGNELEKEILFIRNNYWKVDNLLKPLKAISNYKAEPLRKIALLLKLDIYKSNEKFKNKKKIYEMIRFKIE